MGKFDINQATSSDMTNKVSNVTVDAMQLDGISDQPETTYQTTTWTENYGYFTAIPDLQSALLMKSIWTVGKGYETDNATKQVATQDSIYV